MREAWYCETHDQLGGDLHPKSSNLNDCRMVPMLLVNPNSLVIEKIDGEWPSVLGTVGTCQHWLSDVASAFEGVDR